MPLDSRGRVWRGFFGPARPPTANQRSQSPPMSLRILMASLCFAGFAFTSLPADAAKSPLKRDFNKEFDELTPSEQIAIRAAAKAAYKAKKLTTLNVCADPGNMPLSSIKQEGFQNKLATLLGEAIDRKSVV